MRYNLETDRKEIWEIVYNKLLLIDYFFDDLLYVGEEDAEMWYDEECVGAACDVADAEWVLHGCSKVVFKFREIDNYVFKVPCKGTIYENECDGEFLRYDFEYADVDGGNSWDYCEKEQNIYELAEYQHLNKFFARTTLIGFFDDHPIYISELAQDFDSQDIHETIETNRKQANKIVSAISYCPLSDYTVAILIGQYGKHETNRLIHFLLENHLSDFHSDNIGFINEKLKLIDYSDFNS